MPNLRSMTPVEFEQSTARSGMIYVPEVHHPVFPLAALKMLINGGGLYYADRGSVDSIAKSAQYFGKGDGYLYEHMASTLDMYDFGSVDADEVDTLWAFVTSFIMMSVAILGPHAAWRLWNVVFSETVSGLAVQFPTDGEPVANLQITGNRYAQPGHDSAFPYYALRTHHTLASRLDKEQYFMMAITAPHTAADSYTRIALRGATEFVHMRSADAVRQPLLPGGGVPPGRQLPGAGDFTIAAEITRKRGDLLSDRAMAAARAKFDASMGETWFDLGQVEKWSKRWEKLQRNQLGSQPAWPVLGGIGQLDRLSPSHLFGSVRELSAGYGGGHTEHGGLDFPDQEGTPVFALYDGVIQRHVMGHKAKDPDAPSGGNHIILRHTTPEAPGYVFDSVYAHLLDPSDLSDMQRARLKASLNWGDSDADTVIDSVSKLTTGRKVKKGDLIGFVGTTGNSSGPHLHLGTIWSKKNSLGRSSKKLEVDPELVLRYGAINAGRMSGFTVGAGESTLATGAFTLTAVGEQHGAFVGDSQMRSQLDQQLATALKRWSKDEDKNTLSDIKDDANLGASSPMPSALPAQAAWNQQTAPGPGGAPAQAAPAAPAPPVSPFSDPAIKSSLAAGLQAIGVPFVFADPILTIANQAWSRAMSSGKGSVGAFISDFETHLGSVGVDPAQKEKATDFLRAFATSRQALS